MPTWLVKKIQDVLIPVICNLCNATLRPAVFPDSQKQAIVLPRLKKSTRAVVSSARVNYSASAACDECSGSSPNEFVTARPCETSIETVTLAAG